MIGIAGLSLTIKLNKKWSLKGELDDHEIILRSQVAFEVEVKYLSERRSDHYMEMASIEQVQIACHRKQGLKFLHGCV